MFEAHFGERGLYFIPESGSGKTADAAEPAFKARPNEPAYARLPQSNGAKVNQWGKAIDLVEDSNALAEDVHGAHEPLERLDPRRAEAGNLLGIGGGIPHGGARLPQRPELRRRRDSFCR